MMEIIEIDVLDGKEKIPAAVGSYIEATRLRQYVTDAQHELDRLRQVVRNVYEVWAGSEGIPQPETAPEAYLLQLVEQMRDEAKSGLRKQP